MRTVLATDLAIWPNLSDITKISDAMLASNEVKASLANYILLYDQIFIPSGNLLMLHVLRVLVGEDVFTELIKNNIIVLLRHDTWISYLGNGGGLRFYSHPTDGNPNLATSFFCPLDECIETALRFTYQSYNTKNTNSIKNLLIDKVMPVASNIDTATFKNETYKDIRESPYLRDFLSFRNRGRSLDNLKGIKSNQMRIYAPHSIYETDKNSPEIKAVLRAAFENFVLGISSDVKVTEITGDNYSLALLKAKGQRVGMPIEGKNAFTTIQNISGVPDIGLAFANKQITGEQLLDLRESRHAEALRSWFGEAQPQDSQEDIVRRYVESIGKPSLIESLPAKILRFATTAGIGTIQPCAGLAAGAIDNFILGKWFPVKSPRLFLKHAKSIIINTEEHSPIKSKPLPPSKSGRDRNRLCSCGSGLKYKKCCGK